jgi:hypothetical protein
MKPGYFCKQQNGKGDPEHGKAYTSMWSQFCCYDRRRKEHRDDHYEEFEAINTVQQAVFIRIRLPIGPGVSFRSGSRSSPKLGATEEEGDIGVFIVRKLKQSSKAA